MRNSCYFFYRFHVYCNKCRVLSFVVSPIFCIKLCLSVIAVLCIFEEVSEISRNCFISEEDMNVLGRSRSMLSPENFRKMYTLMTVLAFFKQLLKQRLKIFASNSNCIVWGAVCKVMQHKVLHPFFSYFCLNYMQYNILLQLNYIAAIGIKLL